MSLRARQNGGGPVRNGGGRGGGNGSPGGRGNNSSNASGGNLIHFDGATNSTTITEYAGATATALGNAAIRPLNRLGVAAKFGQCLDRVGATGIFGAIRVTDGVTDLGNSDFTIDFWVSQSTSGYTNNGSSLPYLFWGGGSASPTLPSIALNNFNFTQMQVLISLDGSTWVGGTGVIITPTLTVSTGWEHHAITRSGANLRYFVNGTQKGSTYNIGTTTLPPFPSNMYHLGSYWNAADTGQYAVANYDEFRILKGTAVWTSNFTPPTSAYSTPSG